MIIRRLNVDDAAAYKAIRLELLEVEPQSFGSSFEEESQFEDPMWINRLTKEHIYTFGAIEKDELIGIVLAVTNPRKKVGHVATLNSMFVKKGFRGKQVGNALLNHAIDEMKSLGVEQILLSVVTENAKAISLYERNEFEAYAVEEEAIKLNNYYYDLLLMKRKL